jgi:hypothetical protein
VNSQLKNVICFTALLCFGSVTAGAVDLSECPEYLNGIANHDVTRFGGDAPRTPIQDMANTFLSYVPMNASIPVQVAMPVFLEKNDDQQQQFGDGQQNAFASFGPLEKAPYIAVLTRSTSTAKASDLAIILSKNLPEAADIKFLEVSISGKSQIVNLDSSGMAHIGMNTQELNWDGLYGAKPAFFRPVGWAVWFSVQFPNAYISVDELVGGFQEDMQTLPNGQSVIDPLKLKDSPDYEADIQKNFPEDPDFVLAHFDRVHGEYDSTKDDKLAPPNEKILTGRGGLYTRYRLGSPFKIVYLAKDPRNIEEEKTEGVVSGTGPHFVGAKAEIILNALGQQELMTLYGLENPKSTPDGGPLAWGFTHQWVGTWLKPNQAFVTPQGNYHWHLNHLTKPIAAEVFTPPDVPNENNHYGFPKAAPHN